MAIREVAERANQAFNNHDRAACEALTADDCVIEAPGGMTFRGVKDCVDFLAGWWEGFPDARVAIQAQYIDGDLCVQEGTFYGTQSGTFKTPMGDLPPSGKSVTGKYIESWKVRGDKIVSQHLIFDRLELMEQLGLVPAAAATA